MCHAELSRVQLERRAGAERGSANHSWACRGMVAATQKIDTVRLQERGPAVAPFSKQFYMLPQSMGLEISMRGNCSRTASGYFCAAPVLKTRMRSVFFILPCFNKSSSAP